VLLFSEVEKEAGKEEEEPLTGEDDEERRIAEMGKPMLGDHPKLEVIIEESYEFKVSYFATQFPLSSLIHNPIKSTKGYFHQK